MSSFTIIRSTKSGRIYIYNAIGAELAQCSSMNAVFDYFYNWSVKFSSKYLAFSFTKDKDVILVNLD